MEEHGDEDYDRREVDPDWYDEAIEDTWHQDEVKPLHITINLL